MSEMREKLLLVGAGGFGRVVLELARLSYDCAFVDDGFPVGASVCGIPVVGKVLSLPCLRSSYSLLIVTIGDNQVREKIYRKAMDLGFCFPTLVHPSAFVSPFAKIGWGCILLQHAIVQNGATVGNGVLLNPGVEIHHDSSVDDYVLIYTNSVVRTNARIGKRVRIGSNVTVCNGSFVKDDLDVPDCTAVH